MSVHLSRFLLGCFPRLFLRLLCTAVLSVCTRLVFTLTLATRILNLSRLHFAPGCVRILAHLNSSRPSYPWPLLISRLLFSGKRVSALETMSGFFIVSPSLNQTSSRSHPPPPRPGSPVPRLEFPSGMVEFLVSVLANVFIVPLFLADIFTEYTVLDDGNFLSGQGLDVPCLKASFALGKNSRANLVFSFVSSPDLGV